MRRIVQSVAAALLGLGIAPAGAECRQALALGLDVSGSVDSAEYRLQLDGLAGALLSPDVLSALLAVPGAPVRLYVYEWGGVGSQREVVGWTDLADAGVIAAVSERLRTTGRTPREPATALGQAMLFGAEALATQQACWRRTLDVSGDGKSNIGPRPGDVRSRGIFGGITINALVIGADSPAVGDTRQAEIAELSSYFLAEVVLGPDAFVEVALGYADFERAMARKLLRELETRAVGRAAGGLTKSNISRGRPASDQ